MTDEVNGYDNGYRQIPVNNPRAMSREFLVGYAMGVTAQLVRTPSPALDEPIERS